MSLPGVYCSLVFKGNTLQGLYLREDGQSGPHWDAQLNEVLLRHQLQLIQGHLLLGEFLHRRGWEDVQ